jgi:hypothetical protein
LIMNRLSKISIAVACALGVTAVAAQTVQRGGQTVKPAQTRAPVQVSQTVFGGPASGAAAAPVTATAGTIAAGTTAFIGFGVVAVAGAASDSGKEGTVTHTP